MCQLTALVSIILIAVSTSGLLRITSSAGFLIVKTDLIHQSRLPTTFAHLITTALKASRARFLEASIIPKSIVANATAAARVACVASRYLSSESDPPA